MPEGEQFPPRPEAPKPSSHYSRPWLPFIPPREISGPAIEKSPSQQLPTEGEIASLDAALRAAQETGRKKGMNRRELLKRSGLVGLGIFGAASVAGGITLKRSYDLEYPGKKPFPEIGPQTDTQKRVEAVRKVIESNQPFTLDNARRFAEHLVAPLFIDQGEKELGVPRNLEVRDLLDNTTFIPDFSLQEDSSHKCTPEQFQYMMDLAIKMQLFGVTVNDADIAQAYLWDYLDSTGDLYYLTNIKGNPDAMRGFFHALYADKAVSFTDTSGKGHTVINIQYANELGVFKDSEKHYYLDYQRPDIDNKPRVCEPITYGASMLKVLVHEWQHLDSQQEVDFPKTLPSLEGSALKNAIEKLGFSFTDHKPPITSLSTYNFGLVGLDASDNIVFYASGLLEFATDILATKLIASLGLPPVAVYHSAMDYKNMDVLLEKMGLGWEGFAQLYYTSQIEEFYKRLGKTMTGTDNDLENIMSGLSACTPCTPDFPWSKDNGTSAWIRWKEIGKRVAGVNATRYAEAHKPFRNLPLGIGNWWLYAPFFNNQMEIPLH